jgi:hypothetical protein
LNLAKIINDARVGAVYRVNINIPALRGPAEGGTQSELIISPSNFQHLKLQGNFTPIAP